jgi:hypothetical protein
VKTSKVSGRISREIPVLFEAFALLDRYTAFVGGSLPTFWDNLIGPLFKVTFGDGNDKPFRNVGNKLPTNAA